MRSPLASFRTRCKVPLSEHCDHRRNKSPAAALYNDAIVLVWHPGPAGNTNHEMLANDIEARAAAYRMARELARNRQYSPKERVVVTDLYGAVVDQVYLHTA